MDHQVFPCKKWTSSDIALFGVYSIVFILDWNIFCCFLFIHLSLCLCHPSIHPYIQGGKEFIMRAHFGLPSVEKDEVEGKPPITVKFEIPYFTVSGIQVCVCGCVCIQLWVFMLRLCFIVKQPMNLACSSLSQDRLREKYWTGKTCFVVVYISVDSYKALSITREDRCFKLHIFSLLWSHILLKLMLCAQTRWDLILCSTAHWFFLPQHTASPSPSRFLKVRYMKIIEKSGFQALPWVRYITQSGGTVKICAIDFKIMWHAVFATYCSGQMHL